MCAHENVCDEDKKEPTYTAQPRISDIRTISPKLNFKLLTIIPATVPVDHWGGADVESPVVWRLVAVVVVVAAVVVVVVVAAAVVVVVVVAVVVAVGCGP